MSAPALRVVTADGELLDECPGCSERDDVIRGLERDVRGWAARYAQLARDREAEARRHELWDAAEELFGYWRLRCKHPRSRFTFDRFEVVRPFLEKYGPEVCRKAIDGAAYDPFISTLKNGRTKRHDDWGLVFRDADKVESFVNRAPIEGER